MHTTNVISDDGLLVPTYNNRQTMRVKTVWATPVS